MKNRMLIALMLATQAFAAWAQGDPLARTTRPEELREDLEIIRQTVEQAHPDPYRYHPRSEMEVMFNQVSAALDEPMSAEMFMAEVMPVLRAIGDAGTRLAPPADLMALYEHTAPLIPISVAVIGDKLYLDEELKGFRSLPAACEILRINQHDAAEIMAKLRGGLVPEGADTTLLDRRIEADFPLMYRRHVEAADRFTVEYRKTDGSLGSAEIMALTKDEMRRTFRSKGIDLQPWRLEEMPASRSAWLTLATFDLKELERNKVNPDRFLGSVMNALRKSEATTLVIDVRGAHGDDLGVAEQVFGLIAQKPFRVVRSVSIRNGRVPDSYRYAKPEPEFFAAVGGAYAEEVNGRRELRPDDPRLLPLQPLAKAFAGKVYVVCDGATTGAAAAFAMMAKRTGRARTVGEELGSNAWSFCGGRALEITLPHTGCLLRVPLMRYVPEGNASGAQDRGERPSYQVPKRAADLARGKDTVREALLNLIEELL